MTPCRNTKSIGFLYPNVRNMWSNPVRKACSGVVTGRSTRNQTRGVRERLLGGSTLGRLIVTQLLEVFF